MSARARCIRLLLLLALGACASSGEGSTIASDELLARADRHFARREYEDALGGYKLAAAAAQSEGARIVYVESSSQVAHVYVLMERADEGRPWLTTAAEHATEGEKRGWTRYLLARGAYERSDGQQAEAVATYRMLYDASLAERYHDRAMQAAYMATLVASDDERGAWALRGIEAAAAEGDARWQAAAWSRLAWILEEEGNHAEALRAFSTARDHGRRSDDAHELLKADWMLAHGLRMTGELERARALLERLFAQASRRFVRTRDLNDSEWIARCHEELGEIDATEGNRELALTRFRRARQKYLEAGIEDAAPRELERIDARIAELSAGN